MRGQGRVSAQLIGRCSVQVFRVSLQAASVLIMEGPHFKLTTKMPAAAVRAMQTLLSFTLASLSTTWLSHLPVAMDIATFERHYEVAKQTS